MCPKITKGFLCFLGERIGQNCGKTWRGCCKVWIWYWPEEMQVISCRDTNQAILGGPSKKPLAPSFLNNRWSAKDGFYFLRSSYNFPMMTQIEGKIRFCADEVLKEKWESWVPKYQLNLNFVQAIQVIRVGEAFSMGSLKLGVNEVSEAKPFQPLFIEASPTHPCCHSRSNQGSLNIGQTDTFMIKYPPKHKSWKTLLFAIKRGIEIWKARLFI